MADMAGTINMAGTMGTAGTANEPAGSIGIGKDAGKGSKAAYNTVTVGRYTLSLERCEGGSRYSLTHLDMRRNIDYVGTLNSQGDLVEYYFRLEADGVNENVPVEPSPYTRMLAHELKDRLDRQGTEPCKGTDPDLFG